jgi:hypothetical protein
MVSPISNDLKAKPHIDVPRNRSMRKNGGFPVENRSRTATESAVGTASLEHLPETQNGETKQWLVRFQSI